MKSCIIFIVILFCFCSCNQNKKPDIWSFIDCSLCVSDDLNLSIKIDSIGNVLVLYDKWFQSANVYEFTLSETEKKEITELLNEIGNFIFYAEHSSSSDMRYYHIIAINGQNKIDAFVYNNSKEKTEELYCYLYKLIKKNKQQKNEIFKSKTNLFILDPPLPPARVDF